MVFSLKATQSTLTHPFLRQAAQNFVEFFDWSLIRRWPTSVTSPFRDRIMKIMVFPEPWFGGAYQQAAHPCPVGHYRLYMHIAYFNGVWKAVDVLLSAAPLLLPPLVASWQSTMLISRALFPASLP